jgi:hypothetical protein
MDDVYCPESAWAPSLDGVGMRAVGTDQAGQVDFRTLFLFSQRGSTVSARYAGGAVELGYLVGRVTADRLTFRYCQVDDRGEVHGGHSNCEVGRLPDGRIWLREHFRWESREGGGTNMLEQVEGRLPAGGSPCT